MEKDDIKKLLIKYKDHKITKEEVLKLMDKQVRVSSSEEQIETERHTTIQPKSNDSDIAIIGMSCRFPFANNVEEFWEVINSGTNAITKIPEDRFDINAIYGDPSNEKNKTNCKWGGFLDNINKFDPLFFNISPKEAELMDPQQRLFLMEAWGAFEDAGYSAKKLERMKCGVFVGHADGDYKIRLIQNDIAKDAYYFMGNSGAILSARISYLLNLKGPSLSLDTACSSSLVALHLACESIRNGECQMALAGGVSAFVTPQLYLLAGSAGMLSSDGQCKAFDDGANGFVPAEGVGCVVIKSLKQAIADRDQIYAVIKGSGVNQDGKSNGIMAPNALSQTALERDIYDKYGINPEEIGYIETHGTGTILGDPIEVTALIDTFKHYTNKESYCALGSVKTNIGHAQLAAGAASIIKSVLMLRNKRIPPIVNFKKLNHHIHLEHTPFYINTESKPWETIHEGKRKVSVSGFGFSGTNAHIVLEEYTQRPKLQAQDSKAYYPICISAKSDMALLQELKELQNWIVRYRKDLTIERIAYSLYQYKSHFNLRTSFVVRSIEELEEKLEEYLKNPEMVEIQDSKIQNEITYKLKKDGNESIQKIIQELNQKELIPDEELEKMNCLAESYKAGYLLDADELFKNCVYQRMSMPRYQFDMEKYWYHNGNNKASNHTEDIDTMLTRNTSTIYKQEYEVQLNQSAFYIKEHDIQGSKILPGVAYMELARQSVKAATNKEVESIQQMVWQKPVVVKEEFSPLYVQLKPVEGRVKFEIISKEGTGRELHCQGYATLKSQETHIKKTFDISGIKARLEEVRNQEQHYQYFSQRGMKHGQSMKSVQKLYSGKNDALAFIELPEVIQESRYDYGLHPAIMDGTLQTVIGVKSAVAADLNAVFLPFSLKELKLYAAIPHKLYSYAVQTGNQEFSIWLSDLNGKIVAKMENLQMRSVHNEMKQDLTYMTAKWSRSSLKELMIEPGEVFFLQSNQQEYSVWHCDSNQKISALKEKVPYNKRESLDSYTRFVYIADDMKDENECLECGVYQFFVFLKTIMSQKLHKFIQVLYLYNRKAQHVELLESVNSLCKSAMLENSYLLMTTVGYEAELSKKQIYQELSIKSKAAIQYIQGNRYQEEIVYTNRIEGKPPIAEKGLYVITGGNGKIGRKLANYLASHYHAKVMILGRSIQESDSLGESIIPFKVDISKKEQVINVFHKIVQQYGNITGVFHCAGIHQDSLIWNKTLQGFKEVIAPKVFGTKHLMECIKDMGVEFCALFSSTTSICGTPGQSDYAYANAYLNAYARKYQKDSMRIISICFPFWKDGGMQISSQDKTFMQETMGLGLLSFDEGMEALESALSRKDFNCIVIKGNTQKFLSYLSKTSSAEFTKNKEQLVQRSEQIVPFQITRMGEKNVSQNLYTQVKQVLYDKIVELIKIDPTKIKENHNFTDYGFDSILFTNLANNINETLHIDLMPTIFFDKSLIREFIQYLCDEYPSKMVGNDIVEECIAEQSEDIEEIQKKDNTVALEEVRFLEPEPVWEENIIRKQEVHPDDIAIIGMSGVMPQSDSLEEFFQKLESESDFITEIPKDRWDWKEGGKEDMRWGAFMKDIGTFDTEFFTMSPREAELMDPQQRILLECVWHTIEDSGYKASKLRGSNTGVFIGVSTMDYTDLSKKADIPVSGYTSTGRAHSVLVNRVSYLYDFHGPSEPIDTACSSSLIAVIRGVKSIQSGDCQMAIVGGVNVIASDDLYVAFSKSGMLAEDGRCKTFDKNADGYARGEGVGTILLKSLAKATQDGDHIYAVIKGCGINHGGHASSLTAPNASAQADLIMNTYQKAHINPLDVTYIEAHGTGTKLGDPVEIDGLNKAFRGLFELRQIEQWQEGYCSVGSVKSNIGHLEAAAGIASVFKVLLSMSHHVIPASIHINELNPYLALHKSAFKIAQKTQKWDIPDGKRRIAGISCFGYGGANAHLVLEEYQENHPVVWQSEESNVFLYSAKTKEQLGVSVKNHIAYLEQKQQDSTFSLNSYAYVLQTGREDMEERLSIVALSIKELISILRNYDQKRDFDTFYTGSIETYHNMFQVLNTGVSWNNYANQIYENRDFRAFAVLWANGAIFDWKKLYDDRIPAKIAVPEYPFKKTRYWLPNRTKKDSGSTAHCIHPLIDENISTIDKIIFKKSLSQDDFFIRDHNIQGNTILPGVAYLEMVRAASEQAQENTIRTIEDVIWATPINVGNSAKDSFIELGKIKDKLDYKVYYKEHGQMVIASQGKVSMLSSADSSSAKIFDIAQLRTTFDSKLTRSEAYNYFAKLGFAYGESFKCIQSIESNATEALGKYQVPQIDNVLDSGFKLLIPAMDGALQTIMGTGSSSFDGEEKQYIPFALKKLIIFDTAPQQGYAYMRLHSQNEDGSVRKFDISILGEDGQERVRFEEFTSRAIEALPLPSLNQIEQLHYKKEWKESNSSYAAVKSPDSSLAIVIGNVIEARKYQLELNNLGVIEQHFIQSSNEYQKIDQNTYGIRTRVYEDYVKVLQEFKLNNYREITIYHTFASDEMRMNTLNRKERLDYGFFSMSCLVKALVNCNVSAIVKLAYIYTENKDYIQPENEMINGMIKSITSLNNKILIKTIAVENNGSDAIIAKVVAEMQSKEAYVPGQIWLKQNKRFERVFKKLSIKNQDSLTSLKEGDTVIITGGLGKLGKVFTSYLARKKINVILTGRRDASSENEWLDNIHRYGVKVFYIQSNIAVYEETKAMFEKAKEYAGEISGVLHIAGTAGEETIAKADWESYEQPLQAKVYGTMNLDAVLQNEPLKYVVYFSSIASNIGDYGGCSYACANEFLNAYAQERNEFVKKKYSSGKTYAIQWGIWADGAMKLPNGSEEQYFDITGMVPIPKEQGIEMFQNVLAQDESSIIAVTGNEAITDRILGIQDKAQTINKPYDVEIKPVSKSDTSFNLQDKTKNYLRTVIADSVKIEAQNIRDNTTFDKLGIDSFMVMEIHEVLELHFEELSKTMFFEYHTLTELVKFFLEEHKEELEKMFQADVEETETEYKVIEEGIEKVSKIAGENDEKSETTTKISNKPIKQVSDESDNDEIAIIGISGRYPMSENIEELYQNLKAGKDCIEEIPEERFNYKEFYDEVGGKGKITCKWGGFINDADKFDEEFFGIVPKVASMMDPQERIMLEAAWQAIEDSGYKPEELNIPNKNIRVNDVGVFIGMMYDDYKVIETQELVNHNYDALTEYWNSPIANRISYVFNFSGPSYVIDSACSSSLTTIHMACESIRHGDCNYAIAGGVSLSLHPSKYLRLADFGMSSPTGSCKSFGQGADGYVPGEGVGAVLLKPLAQAKKDGDNIYAVIIGSSVNHGGKVNGFTVPNPNAQSDVIVHALETSNVDARSISYVETHGTGTKLGDPIEIRGLTKAFNTKDKQFCKLGSIKSNVGHCEGAAGIASITKVALQLKNKQLFPSLHAEAENELIDFKNSPFAIQKKLEYWEQPSIEIDGSKVTFPRRAGISSFGAGGSNAHVIMEEYSKDDCIAVTKNNNELMFISAGNEDAFKQLLHNWIDYLDKTDELLHNIAFTSVAGRIFREYRLSLVAESKEDAKQQIQDYLEQKTERAYFGSIKHEKDSAVINDDFMNHVEKRELDSIAKLWVEGYELDYTAIFGTDQSYRVSIPKHPLRKNRHWITTTYDSNDIAASRAIPSKPDKLSVQEQMESLDKSPVQAVIKNVENKKVQTVMNNEESKKVQLVTKGQVSEYLIQILSDVTQLQKEKLDLDTEFSEYGIDSIGITSFNNSILKDFPGISETALFAYQTIQDLTDYMYETYEDEVRDYFGDDSMAVQETPIIQDMPIQDSVTNNNRSIEKDNSKKLRDVTAEFLISILAEVTQISAQKLDPAEDFGEYGIDSIGISSFGKQILGYLPSISETAIYAYQTIDDLTYFICETCEEELKEMFGIDEENTKESAPVVVKEAKQHEKQVNSSDIAIIGVSSKLPGSKNWEELWNQLINKESASQKISRWDMSEYYDEELGKPGKTYCQYGSFLDDIDKFDPQFFHIAKTEADVIDPQERMFLQEAWNAVENAGYTKKSIDRNTGVFVGVTTSSYHYVGYEESLKGNSGNTSTSFASIANRVSYMLDLKGPSMPIDTMCSSAIVAIHMACEAIHEGKCNMVIAGGVNLYSHPMALVNLSRLKLLSSDDMTRSFCEGGKGFVPGEAVGAVILKRAEDAIKDGDYIYAVIKGSAAGHIGRTNAYFTQNPLRQAEIIENAVKNANVPKESISYIETVGIGTEVNDSIEVEGLKKVFQGEDLPEHSIAIGSVKPNIGHAEAASGIGQLMKVLLQLKLKKIAPTRLNGTLNKKMQLNHTTLYEADEQERWEQKQGKEGVYPRRASINSFGAGGYAANIIVEEAPKQYDALENMEDDHTALGFPISSNTKGGVIRNLKNLKEYCQQNTDVSMNDIAYNLQRKNTYQYRVLIVADSKNDLLNKLENCCNGLLDIVGVYNNCISSKSIASDGNALYYELAMNWIKGNTVDWAMTKVKHNRKIPLPGYSFEPIHCWSGQKENINNVGLVLQMGNAKLEQFCNGILLKYLQDGGVFQEANPIKEQINKLSNKEKIPVVQKLIQILMDHDYVTQINESLQLTDKINDEVIKVVMKQPEKREDFLCRAFPELTGHLQFLRKLGEKMHNILHIDNYMQEYVLEEDSFPIVLKNETRFDQMLLYYFHDALEMLLNDYIGTVTILDDCTFSTNIGRQILTLCEANNISVKYYLYDSISYIAATKKELLEELGVGVELISEEQLLQMQAEADFILTGRRTELSAATNNEEAMCIRYIPALTEYFLILYQIMGEPLDSKQFLSIPTDQLLVIKSAKVLGKRSESTIADDVLKYIAKELGVLESDLDIHVDLKEYGLNSILMARLYTQLVEKFGDSLEPRDVLQSENASQIIESIEAKLQDRKTTEVEKTLEKTESKALDNYFVASSGNMYEYTIEGDGEPLLVLTALAFTPEIWKYQKEAWMQKYKMIFPTLPGHGNSKSNEQKVKFSDIADDISEFMDYQGIDSINILGWCMAGNILQNFIVSHPEKVKKVCLICTTPEDASVRGVSSNDLKEYSENPLGTYELEFMNIFGADIGMQSRIQKYMQLIKAAHCQVDSVALLCYINELFQFDIKKMKEYVLDIPVLIIAGKWDITYPAEQVKQLTNVFKNAKFEVYEQSGHMPFISESDKFNKQIQQFLHGEE